MRLCPWTLSRLPSLLSLSKQNFSSICWTLLPLILPLAWILFTRVLLPCLIIQFMLPSFQQKFLPHLFYWKYFAPKRFGMKFCNNMLVRHFNCYEGCKIVFRLFCLKQVLYSKRRWHICFFKLNMTKMGLCLHNGKIKLKVKIILQKGLSVKVPLLIKSGLVIWRDYTIEIV